MTYLESPYHKRIKVYSDGADKKSMLEMNNNSQIQGLTTNPSLMKKAGISDYRTFCKDILTHIKEKPISFEVFSDNLTEMRRQALEINSWGKNIYVKIPICNSEGVSTIPLVQELSHMQVKLNVTAIFTWKQILETCMAVKGGAPSIVSIFSGRIADTGRDPVPMMTAASELCRGLDSNIELLWASCREVFNVVQAEQSGCHIITVPPDIIKKMSLINKGLYEMSLDTVRTFKADSEAAGFSL